MVTDPDGQPKPRFRHYMREWRKKKGLSQGELGELVNASKAVISRYENGSRPLTIDMSFRIMVALGITPEQFFSDPDRPSLEALLANQTPERRRRIVNVAKALAGDDDII